MHQPHAGLCVRCQNVRILRSARGSVFVLCQLHDRDPRFDKYPRLPVLVCAGFLPIEEGDAS